jgi:GNAT superfamily N-acetyltransferase
METVTFRPAVANDLSSIVALLADDVLGSQRENARLPLDSAYLAAFEAIEVDPNQLLVVAVDGEEIVGTLQLTFIPGIARKGAWRGQIEAVRIAASRRDQGLGKQLFDWAIGECRARGCGFVQLTTHRDRSDAHRFYDRLGFVASHIGYKMAL